MITTEVHGLTEIEAKLDRMSPELQGKMRNFVATRLIALRDAVKANIASMLRGGGPLYNAVQTEMEEEAGSFTGTVFIDGEAIPYAQIQERGGRTGPHDIFPVNGNFLAFMAPAKMGFSGGPKMSGMIFTKHVHHPGSNIPEHPYARAALAREKPVFFDGIRQIVESVVGA